MPYLEVVVSRRRGAEDVLSLTGIYRLVSGASLVITVIRDVFGGDIIQDHTKNIGSYA